MTTFAEKYRASLCILAVLALAVAIAGCGGGGGGSSSLPAATATIQGAVPGTVFIAVDNATGFEAGRATATGTPKTFSMTVPTGASYRFYLMENEGTGSARVYPMYVGANNVFALDNAANGQVIALGMISPDLGTGKANPANAPALMTGQGANSMIPPSLAGSAFSMDNVMGTTWAYNTMMTSGTMGWEHGTLSFDNNTGQMSGIVRNGTPLSPRVGIPFSMSLSGMMRNPADNTFQGVMSRDMSVMVGTFTDNSGGPAMMIAQKRGGSYHADGSDMTGTWRFQRLTAGTDNMSSGWAYGTMTFVSGSATITSMTTSAGVGGGGSFSFSMDGAGIVTENGNASFYGVMSSDKTMIVATDTEGGTPALWVLMKDTTTYSMSDTTGDWVMHAVSSGNPGSRQWAYGQSVMDASGNDTFSGMMGSSGPDPGTQMTFQMSSGGDVTMGGAGGGMMGGGSMGGGMMGGGMVTTTFHGIVNGAKDIMVSTYSDGSGGYPLSIQVK